MKKYDQFISGKVSFFGLQFFRANKNDVEIIFDGMALTKKQYFILFYSLPANEHVGWIKEYNSGL